MLCNSDDLLLKAYKEGYAIPAYNINNLEWTKYILKACVEDNSPVILAVTESAIKYFGGYHTVVNTVKSLVQDMNVKIPVVLHLDHGSSYESCIKAIDAGFTSVMFDGSNLSLDENVDITNKIIEYAKAHDVSVEAEIGNLGADENPSEPVYSDFDEVTEFVSRTDIDSLAPSIGNVHGIYKGEPKLNFELLGSICKAVKIPLVLHGASGLDENKIKTAIFCGVSKININTDLQYAWASAVRIYLNQNKDVYDPRKIIGSGEKAIINTIKQKNILFGSNNKVY